MENKDREKKAALFADWFTVANFCLQNSKVFVADVCKCRQAFTDQWDGFEDTGLTW